MLVYRAGFGLEGDDVGRPKTPGIITCERVDRL